MVKRYLEIYYLHDPFFDFWRRIGARVSCRQESRRSGCESEVGMCGIPR
jgi:hypothetical protein